MSNGQSYDHIYADLMMEFGRHYVGECDACARYALMKFIRITAIEAVETGKFRYPPIRNYLIRRFRAIGQRVTRSIGTEPVASHDLVVQAIAMEVAEAKRLLIESGRAEVPTPVCQNFSPDDLKECPSEIGECGAEERYYV